MVFMDWLLGAVDHPKYWDSEWKSIQKAKKEKADKAKKKEGSEEVGEEEMPKEEKKKKPVRTPPSSRSTARPCITAQELIDELNSHSTSDEDTRRLNAGQISLEQWLLPTLNRRGGRGIVEREMKATMEFFACVIFLRSLRSTQFVWREGLEAERGVPSFCNDEGTRIEMDPAS